jgi:hypothetical protein
MAPKKLSDSARPATSNVVPLRTLAAIEPQAERPRGLLRDELRQRRIDDAHRKRLAGLATVTQNLHELIVKLEEKYDRPSQRPQSAAKLRIVPPRGGR